MLRTMIRSGIAVGVAVFAARQAIFAGRDLNRYNKMREMSGDPPLPGKQTRKPATNSEARQTNPFVMLASIPSDLSRYFKLKSM